MNAKSISPWIFNRKALVRCAILLLILLSIMLGFWSMMFYMPGESYQGTLPKLNEQKKTIAKSLKSHVEILASEYKERNLANLDVLNGAANYIIYSLTRTQYSIERDEYKVKDDLFFNIIAEKKGTFLADEIIIVGAHYDAVVGSPAANDNASGVAATIELARAMHDSLVERTIRFVFFVNEEPPYFQSENMGSRVYARRCKERGDNIIAMMSLETIGYYSDEPNSQEYPHPLKYMYPDKGNFIGFIGNVSSRHLVRECILEFRESIQFPSEGAALPESLPGVGWSDHWSFWQEGYPAIMVTDTAPFRYPYYHSAEDTPDKLDYDRMARVVVGLKTIVENLVMTP